MTDHNKIIEASEKLIASLATLSEPELVRLIKLHNKNYFEFNAPEITDEAFDKLVETLRFVNPHAPVLSEIGSRSSAFGNEVVHALPMLSLEKCYDDASFLKWAKKINGGFVVMPKIDGVACSIVYRDGTLVQAATRGDGRVGEDITKNALLIHDLPKQLPIPQMKDRELEVRGEIYLPLSIFNTRFASEFVNPRNLAAGFVKLKEEDRSKTSFLRFFPYDVRGVHVATEQEKFVLLADLGFSMMPWSVVENNEKATAIYVTFLTSRDEFDYETDGVVFRANLIADQVRLGATAHHPRYAIAYKFQGETAQTKLIDVVWSVARSGIITPVAIVEPVFVSGASIRRASLHNLRIFSELDLHEQSLVEINRRGGVIPHLERVLSRKGEKLPIPTACPSCGGPVQQVDDFLRCVNHEQCETVGVSKLVHFVHVLGIEGLGDKIIRRLYDAGFIRNFGDIFRLTTSMFLTLERMGEVLAQKLVDEIDRKRSLELSTFIKALGIPEIGTNVSELVASNFHSLSTIRNLSVDDLLALHGIGERIAHALVNGLHERSAEIDDLLGEVTIVKSDVSSADLDHSHPLFGKSVLFTGKMAHLERKAAQQAVKNLGGRAPEAMSSAVDFLVIGDEGSPLLGEGKKSTKQKAAEKLIAAGSSMQIISERDFLKLLGK